jgi:hypothetical protein
MNAGSSVNEIVTLGQFPRTEATFDVATNVKDVVYTAVASTLNYV